MIEVNATLDHLLMGLLHAYKLRDLPVDVAVVNSEELAITFVLSLSQRFLYRRRIAAFGRELGRYVRGLYTIKIRTERNLAWLTLI